ncbi:hypothetical protein Hanom_Chr11g01054501 [Helianthus anomalus]
MEISFYSVNFYFYDFFCTLKNTLKFSKPNVPRGAPKRSILLLNDDYVNGPTKWVKRGCNRIYTLRKVASHSTNHLIFLLVKSRMFVDF